MEILDASALGKQALRIGLLTEEQFKDALEEAGTRNPEIHALIRILERKTLLTPWQSAKLLKGEFDGFFLGGYRLLYRIASGSFGRVYRADDPASGRIVAVKVLRRRWSEDANRIELFAREAKVGLTLKHQNIVEILAMSQDPASKQYYIVMEFVEGGNLREILQIRKKLPVSVALRIVEDAAAGLAYAHSRGYTHRDIKPTNLLISSTGATKLVDFGLAGITAGGDDKEERQERTVDYAGLERATGVKAGDPRSDIYFLGCVLFEMLTGKSPLSPAHDKNQRMQRHRFENLAKLEPAEIEGPPSLCLLVDTMTALSPQRRFQTSAQLLDSIKSIRREIEGPPAGGAASTTQQSLFVVERDERLQDALREKFKELGYRVLMAGDPLRALDRFRQQPFRGLILDVGTTGEEGLLIFDQIMIEAQQKQVHVAGIAILNDDQAALAERIAPRPRQAVLLRPVTLKQLHRKLTELMAEE